MNSDQASFRMSSGFRFHSRSLSRNADEGIGVGVQPEVVGRTFSGNGGKLAPEEKDETMMKT